MAKNKEIKTNAMRILEKEKIPFTHYTYECDEFIDGIQIADKLSQYDLDAMLIVSEPGERYAVGFQGEGYVDRKSVV